MAAAAEGSLDRVSVIGFKGCQAGVEQLALRDDDDVEARRELVTTENLSNQTFSAVSDDCAAQLARGGNPQPADRPFVPHDEHGAVTAVDADAALVNLLKIGAAANAFGRTKILTVDRRATRCSP